MGAMLTKKNTGDLMIFTQKIKNAAFIINIKKKYLLVQPSIY